MRSGFSRNLFYLVEVPKAHPLYGRSLPLGQWRHKLDGGRLLLEYAERQRAHHRVALVDERLRCGAGVDGDYLATWREMGIFFFFKSLFCLL